MSTLQNTFFRRQIPFIVALLLLFPVRALGNVSRDGGRRFDAVLRLRDAGRWLACADGVHAPCNAGLLRQQLGVNDPVADRAPPPDASVLSARSFAARRAMWPRPSMAEPAMAALTPPPKPRR